MEINYKKYPFAQKIRHHVSATNYIPFKEIKGTPEGYPALIEKADWNEYFINGKAPDALDIGCGKGYFLLKHTTFKPDQNILGIELRTEAVEWINKVIDGEKIPNARVICYNVTNGLDFIEDHSIDSIYYLFPDPWPKQRHHKRRAFTDEFLNICFKKLKNDGRLYLATDVDYVNLYQTKVIIRNNKFEINYIEERDDWKLPFTNKENFCIKNNIQVYRQILTKKSAE